MNYELLEEAILGTFNNGYTELEILLMAQAVIIEQILQLIKEK